MRTASVMSMWYYVVLFRHSVLSKIVSHTSFSLLTIVCPWQYRLMRTASVMSMWYYVVLFRHWINLMIHFLISWKNNWTIKCWSKHTHNISHSFSPFSSCRIHLQWYFLQVCIHAGDFSWGVWPRLRMAKHLRPSSTQLLGGVWRVRKLRERGSYLRK